MGIQVIRSFAYNSQSQGLVECNIGIWKGLFKKHPTQWVWYTVTTQKRPNMGPTGTRKRFKTKSFKQGRQGMRAQNEEEIKDWTTKTDI